MTTVLHVLSMSWFSGAENVAITLIRGFHERSLPFSFIYASPEGSIRGIVEENEIKYAPIKKVSISEIKRLIKEYKPGIIHAHDRTASMICAFAARNIPVLSHLHNNAPLMKNINLKTLLYGLSCIRYKKILGVSNAVFEEYIFHKLIDKKAVVVGNPINIKRIQTLGTEFDVQKQFDVIYVGRLSIPKNPILFVDVAKLILKRRPETTIAIVGDGEMKEDVEDRITQFGYKESICMLGFKKNPYPYLKNAKVLCMTPKWEGFGLVAVEALALGKPVIATPVGGLKNIIDSTCGKFCKSAEEFSENIIDVLDNKAKLDALSIGAVRKAEELDNIDQFIEMIRTIYEESL
ncbi:MAG: glycosyltransferase [Clostridia bacterium]|nr:glycosyltransferase [Clostridia bacterium]